MGSRDESDSNNVTIYSVLLTEITSVVVPIVIFDTFRGNTKFFCRDFNLRAIHEFHDTFRHRTIDIWCIPLMMAY